MMMGAAHFHSSDIINKTISTLRRSGHVHSEKFDESQSLERRHQSNISEELQNLQQQSNESQSCGK